MSIVPDSISQEELFKIWFAKLTAEQKEVVIDVLREFKARRKRKES